MTDQTCWQMMVPKLERTITTANRYTSDIPWQYTLAHSDVGNDSKRRQLVVLKATGLQSLSWNQSFTQKPFLSSEPPVNVFRFQRSLPISNPGDTRLISLAL